MEKEVLIHELKEHGIPTKAHFQSEAFSRNIGLLTRAEQAVLAETRVAIPGMGGVGGVHLMTLVRMGVGKFHLADFDKFEAANINRQYGARVPDFGRNKLEVMKEEALSVNPYAEIRGFPQGISESNLDDFLNGVDVVLDSLDFFEFDIRRMLFNRAREKGAYVITAGPLGFSGALLIFSPHEGMGFDEYFNIVSGMTPQDHYLSFAIGLAPRATHFKYMDTSKVDLNAKAGPSSIIAVQLCAGMAAAEVLRIILKRGRIRPVPCFFQFDPYRQIFRRGKMRGGNRHPLQRIRHAVINTVLGKKRHTIRPEAASIPSFSKAGSSIPPDVLSYILKAGIQAPSGDNVQPWKFKIGNDFIDLYIDRAADFSFFNVNQIASIISCGAVMENMKISASLFALDTEIQTFPEGVENVSRLASVRFRASDAASDPLSHFIWERCTNRKFFSREVIPENILAEIRSAVSIFPGIRLHLITHRQGLKRFANIVCQADRIRTEHRPLHEHLNQMIRFTNEEAMVKRDGFPLKNLEAGMAGNLFLRATRSWPAMNMANQLKIGRMVPLHAKLSVFRASGVGLLTASGMSVEDFLKGGRALERLWLTLTRLGVSFQPMAAVNLFWMRWRMGGENDFSPKHRKLLSVVWQTYQNLFQDVDFSEEGHVMLFRFGYGKPIGQRTIRKDVNDLMMEKMQTGE